MNILIRRALVLMLLMLQGMAPLLHAHAGLASMEHSGLHLPELSVAAAGTDQDRTVLSTSDSQLWTLGLANMPRNQLDNSVAPPAQPVLYRPVPVAEAEPSWIPEPLTLPASLQAASLIPYSCAPPRA